MARRADFCCDGCAAAAQWIGDADLDAYYRLRERPGARIDEDDGALALWDREEVQAEHARTIDDGGREITLLTDGMRCAACAWLIDRALSREAGVLDSQAPMPSPGASASPGIRRGRRCRGRCGGCNRWATGRSWPPACSTGTRAPARTQPLAAADRHRRAGQRCRR
jgi:hypothetical protein